MSENGNGKSRRNLFDPVIVFIRLFQNIWIRQNRVSGSTDVVDGDTVSKELEDRLDPPEFPDTDS
ncbi:hypothetical protein DSM106972_023910 [Dulcicalothrix desertica PCC 7102]|uniref:Uncharacterized protein n=1 Tax=Dulcicalothrix desertica PCC 7102 TaxID=232991 RepID=A0A433VM14_9CYAN|nr:hypothetical protein [Dulcicalothrix desertica]RUT07130.1 hypothetical protein DSM106972_023910 [Dulcicalothrix desertica PCC 7102]TWH61873.1 hypothetical protein CAL7102_00551 [Dulcicalothrix desertica PCC 7102]